MSRNYKGLDFSSYQTKHLLTVQSTLIKLIKAKINYTIWKSINPYFCLDEYKCICCAELKICVKCPWNEINKAFFKKTTCRNIRVFPLYNLKQKKNLNIRMRKVLKVVEKELTKRITPGEDNV